MNPKPLALLLVMVFVGLTLAGCSTTQKAPEPIVEVFGEAALFEFDKAELTPDGEARLQAYRVEAEANFNRADKIKITGYTDNVGTPEYNTQLSQKRAESVRDYLVSIGVDANKMEVNAGGEANPIADNGTKEGRAKNRRVEIEVTGYR